MGAMAGGAINRAPTVAYPGRLLELVQVSHDQYLHSFWVGWYQSQRFGVVGDVFRRLLLGNGIDQILILALKCRLLLVQILQLLVCRDCLAKLRQVENSH